MKQQYDVIVIGSGIGGLMAALTCARANRSVLVLEAAKQFGGYTNGFARKHFHFDPGIHYIGECGEGGAFRRLLDGVGLNEVAFTELDPDGFDWYVFPDYNVHNCRDLDRFRDRLAADFPSEKKGLDRLFQLVRNVSATTRAATRIRGPGDALKALRHAPTMLRWGRSTLSELLDTLFVDPHLKAAVCGPIGDLGLPPSRVSAMMHLGVLAHYSRGAYFPKGGSNVMRDAFLQGLERHGAVLKRNARVDKILHDGERVTGVRCAGGEQHLGKIVVSNAQASSTYEMLGHEVLSKRLRRKLDNLEHSVGSLCIFMGVDGALDTSKVGSSNVWNYSSHDIDRLYDGALAGELPKALSYFLTVPSNKDPDSPLAPEGKQVVEMVTMAAGAPFKKWFKDKSMKRGDEYEALKKDLADQYIAAAETHLPGLGEAVELLEVGTPATNYSYTLSPEGNIYGPAHTPAQVPPFRFGFRGPMDGLLLCGSSVISAGILPCAASGNIAGRLALRQLSAKPSVFQVPVTFLRKVLQ